MLKLYQSPVRPKLEYCVLAKVLALYGADLAFRHSFYAPPLIGGGIKR